MDKLTWSTAITPLNQKQKILSPRNFIFEFRSRRDHTGYPMPIDDDDGLSFGYQAPEDVTAALKRSFRKERESGGGEGLGPFVYHAEGLTFAYLDHEGVDTGVSTRA